MQEPHALVEALTFHGVAMELTGNYALAGERYAEGLETARAIGDRWYSAMCFTLQTGLLGITQSLVDLETTHARFQEAVANWRAIGDPRFHRQCTDQFSPCASWLGKYAERRALQEESLALCLSIGDRQGLAFAYRGLGLNRPGAGRPCPGSGAIQEGAGHPQRYRGRVARMWRASWPSWAEVSWPWETKPRPGKSGTSHCSSPTRRWCHSSPWKRFWRGMPVRQAGRAGICPGIGVGCFAASCLSPRTQAARCNSCVRNWRRN